MIGIYDEAGARLAMGLSGLSLNDPADDGLDTFEVNAVTYSDALDTTTDADPAHDGVELGAVRKTMYVAHIAGVIRAPTLTKLFDKRRDLAAAYDPATLYRKNLATAGVVPFDFSTPTLDTTNFPTGLVPSRYYVRPQRMVMPPVSVYAGTSCYFDLALVIQDPRRYRRATSTLAGIGTATNIGDYATYPTMTISMTGAGPANYTLTRTDAYGVVKALVLNLSGRVNGETVTIDMAKSKISVNAVETPALYVSGDYFDLSAGANGIVISDYLGTVGSAGQILSWRPAWSY